jgi:hypothetical protein
MSNYTKATNFATKDTLPTGDAGKIVKGTEIDSEFNAIASAISSKADTASPTFTGTPAAPTAGSGTNTTQIATTAFVTSALSGLGNMSTQAKSAVDITGGTIVGITDLAIADGGTGASTASDARTNLGLGSLATLSAVATANITDANVTTAKIADANITAAKLSGAQSGSAPVFGVRAWVNFNGTGSTGTNQTIRGSGNVASVYKNGTGDYTITFTTAMSDANYSVIAIHNTIDSGRTATVYLHTLLAGSVRIQNYFPTAGSDPTDADIVCVQIIR